MKPLEMAIIVEPTAWHVPGWIGRLADRDDVTRVYLSDPTGETESAAREAFGERLAGVFESPAALFQTARPDVAVVTLEPQHTPAACEAALDAGCHVLYEKPGAVTPEELWRLADKARAVDRQLVCAFANRAAPHIRYVRQAVLDGLIGDVWSVNAVSVARDRLARGWRDYGGGWLFDQARGGGWLTFLGCHTIDVIRYVTGKEFARVTAFAGRVHDEPYEVDDTDAIAFTLSGGGYGTLLTGYELPQHPDQGALAIYGSEGWLRTDALGIGDTTVTCHSRRATSQVTHNWRVVFDRADPLDAPYRVMADEFLAAARGEGPTPCEPQAGPRMLEFARAVRRASETGHTQSLDSA